MAEQKKLYGCVLGEDGLYHSEYGDVFTERQLRSSAYGCLLMAMAVAGLVACGVGAVVQKIRHAGDKKAPAIVQKQAVNPVLTNSVPFVVNER